MRAAHFASELAGEEHVVEAVPEAIDELFADTTEVARWQEEPEVGQLGEPTQSLRFGAQELSKQRPRRPVGQKKAEPIAGVVEVAFGEARETERIIVTQCDGREGQLTAPLGAHRRVRRESQPMQKPIR